MIVSKIPLRMSWLKLDNVVSAILPKCKLLDNVADNTSKRSNSFDCAKWYKNNLMTNNWELINSLKLSLADYYSRRSMIQLVKLSHWTKLTPKCTLNLRSIHKLISDKTLSLLSSINSWIFSNVILKFQACLRPLLAVILASARQLCWDNAATNKPIFIVWKVLLLVIQLNYCQLYILQVVVLWNKARYWFRTLETNSIHIPIRAFAIGGHWTLMNIWYQRCITQWLTCLIATYSTFLNLMALDRIDKYTFVIQELTLLLICNLSYFLRKLSTQTNIHIRASQAT